MRDRLAEHKIPLTCAVQLRAMLRGEGVEGNEIRGGNWLRVASYVVERGWASHNFSKSAQPRPALTGRRNKVTIDVDVCGSEERYFIVRGVQGEFLERVPRLELKLWVYCNVRR